jgi:invasion protein IalB
MKLNMSGRWGELSGKIWIACAISMAVLFDAGSAEAQTTRIEKYYDNWKIECRDNDQGKRCGIVYALLNRESKQVVFSWTIVPDDENTEMQKAIVRTPLGVLLPAGLTVTFPGSNPLTIDFRTCGQRGCLSEIPLTDQWVKALRSQEMMTVSYKSANENDLQHEVNLEQFGDAFDFYLAEIE